MSNEEWLAYINKNYPPSDRIYVKPKMGKTIPTGTLNKAKVEINLEKVCCDMQEIIEISSQRNHSFVRMLREKSKPIYEVKATHKADGISYFGEGRWDIPRIEVKR